MVVLPHEIFVSMILLLASSTSRICLLLVCWLFMKTMLFANVFPSAPFPMMTPLFIALTIVFSTIVRPVILPEPAKSCRLADRLCSSKQLAMRLVPPLAAQ